MGVSVFRLLKDWEYWPSYMFYLPNVPYAAFLALRARNLMVFSATNPVVIHSGNGSESKFETLKLLPPHLIPKSVLVKHGTPINEVVNKIEKANIVYPLILKPDIGFRGLLVKKIDNVDILTDYMNNYGEIDIIAQEFIDHKNECGIFYHRLPDKTTGNVTSLTLKKYLRLTGNGHNTLRELVISDDRARRYLALFEEQYESIMDTIIPLEKEFQLSTIGNHSKGTQFINGEALIDKELAQVFDSIFEEIQGWFYGRLDLKYDSIEALKQGKGFKIIELNGIISEPTHIYDGLSMNYWKALKAIRDHWKILFDIAVLNHRKYKVPVSSIPGFLKSLKEIRNHKRHIKALNKVK